MKIAKKLAALALLGLWATGCPQLLDDNFESVPVGPDASLGGAGTGGVDGGADAGSGGTSGDAGAAGDGGDPCASCTASQTCCDGQCVDLSSDWQHCGSCDNSCPGTSCANNTCSSTCVLPFLNCDQNVITNGCEVNAASDPDNCGSCGASCSFDATCENGLCTCPAGSADCNGNKDDGCEANTASDPENCGGCGTVCGANQECVAGACTCVMSYADCNGDANDGCEVNLNVTTAHCGSCTSSCSDNRECSGGTCSCGPDFLDCTAAPGCETPKTDPNNCGSCNTKCLGATPVCNGTACVAACGSGETLCGSSCVDVTKDPNNCGSCGNAVGAHQVCVSGSIECATGWGDCNGQASDGCEIDLTSNKDYCGACLNSKCKDGAICSNGSCQCAAGTPKDCGSECRQCCGNADCSDGDLCTTDTCNGSGECQFGLACEGGGVCCAGQGCNECCGDGDCTGGKVCSGNTCVLPNCSSPEILCDGSCVNPTNDPSHCGGCGNACGPGRSCSSSKCTPQWLSMAPPPGGLVARSGAAVAYIPSLGKVFVWGGLDGSNKTLATGGLYDMAQNTWTLAGTSGAPSARTLATAVWTGTRVAVWGGGDATGTTEYNDGALYDPSNDTWTPMTTAGEPPPGARAAFGFWTGTRVLIWGGYTGVGTNSTVGSDVYFYDTQNGTWSKGSSSGKPSAVLHPAAAFSANTLYVADGQASNGKASKDAYTYNVTSSVWTKLLKGPSERYGAFGAWDSSSFVVWGGHNDTGPVTYDDGQRYDPNGPPGNPWTTMNQTGAPSARYALQRETGWSFRTSSDTVLFIGGVDTAGTLLANGALYNSTTNAWTLVPAWPSGEAHRFGAGVWAGGEFVVWGGTSSGAPTVTGERFRP